MYMFSCSVIGLIRDQGSVLVSLVLNPLMLGYKLASLKKASAPFKNINFGNGFEKCIVFENIRLEPRFGPTHVWT